MKRILMACVLFIAVAGIGLADDAEKALKELNGSYKLVSMSKGGMKAPDEVLKGIKAITLKDGSFKIELKDREETAKFTVNPKEKPAHFDLTPTSGAEKDVLMKGIYKFEKGKLTLTLNDKGSRPKDHDEASEGTGTLVLEKLEEKK